MPKIFEIFGFPLTNKSEEATWHRKHCICPFSGVDCDGGGNRYLSDVNLKKTKSLKSFFIKKKVVPAAVCSIQLHPEEAPWIVCPRRLLTFKTADAKHDHRQLDTQNEILKLLKLPKGSVLGIWPEVKLQYEENISGTVKSFDYTFDYILAPIGKCSQKEMEKTTGKPWATLKKTLVSGGYKIKKQGKEEYVDNFIVGAPHIIEIMTSSTSGGNKTKRTTIPLSFEDAMLGKSHDAPGVNYRQVWARMVSQLVVKSEVAMNWGGKTIWVVQDVLLNYIKSTTGLNLDKLMAKEVSEVNMLCFSYNDDLTKMRDGLADLGDAKLYAGPISSQAPSASKPAPSFQDMIRTPVCPPLEALATLLAKRKPTYSANTP